MADAVTARTLLDGPRNLVVALTSLSDGTGESAVKKVDVASTVSLSLVRIWFNVFGMNVGIFWDATTDDKIMDLQGWGYFDFSTFGGIPNPQSSGWTGDVMLTTTGHSSGDSYVIVLEFKKN